jgi:TolB protein
LLLLLPLIAAGALAQTQITTSIGPNQAATSIKIVVPRPDTALPLEAYNSQFWAPFTRDLTYSGVYAFVPYPPNVPVDAALTKRLDAQFFLLTTIRTEEQDHVIEVRLIDTTAKQQFGHVYRGTKGALTRMAHMIANDLVRMANGKPSVFLSQIAFASNRDGNFEIYLMDWDGGSQRRITRHNALSILPSWSPDNERMVYTSFFAGTSDMYIISRRGGARIKLKTGLNLNTSATFAPVGNDIAFVGSINGNPDIYLIKDDGTNIRRLTTDSTIESTPEWSPNGRQISFTSGRGGTPQIYVMDAEGSNVRRMSFEGDWNDDATWSPNGDEIAYTSRVNGRFQIRIQNAVTGQSRILVGEGSNEQPTWSPDGQWLAFQSNRSGTWQIYRMRVDGTDIQQLTFDGENKDPDWSKKPE